MVLTLGLPASENDVCLFSDVEQSGPGSLYPDNYVAVCARNNITKGKSATAFDPYNNITRAQVMTMVVRAAPLAGVTLNQPTSAYYADSRYIFRDFEDVNHGLNAQIAELSGLLWGIRLESGGGWDPWKKATRGEVAQILWRFRQKMGPPPVTTADFVGVWNGMETQTSTDRRFMIRIVISQTADGLKADFFSQIGGALPATPQFSGTGRLEDGTVAIATTQYLNGAPFARVSCRLSILPDGRLHEERHHEKIENEVTYDTIGDLSRFIAGQLSNPCWAILAGADPPQWRWDSRIGEPTVQLVPGTRLIYRALVRDQFGNALTKTDVSSCSPKMITIYTPSGSTSPIRSTWDPASYTTDAEGYLFWTKEGAGYGGTTNAGDVVAASFWLDYDQDDTIDAGAETESNIPGWGTPWAQWQFIPKQ
jgi:hypothetical protein